MASQDCSYDEWTGEIIIWEPESNQILCKAAHKGCGLPSTTWKVRPHASCTDIFGRGIYQGQGRFSSEKRKGKIPSSEREGKIASKTQRGCESFTETPRPVLVPRALPWTQPSRRNCSEVALARWRVANGNPRSLRQDPCRIFKHCRLFGRASRISQSNGAWSKFPSHFQGLLHESLCFGGA